MAVGSFSCARDAFILIEPAAPQQFDLMAQRSLFDLQELDFESQFRVRRNIPARSFFSVGELGRNDEFALAADLHADHALIPASDDLSITEDELERLLAIETAIELGAVGEPTRVVHPDDVVFLGCPTFADLQVCAFQPAAAARQGQTTNGQDTTKETLHVRFGSKV